VSGGTDVTSGVRSGHNIRYGAQASAVLMLASVDYRLTIGMALTRRSGVNVSAQNFKE
jgi:hypothetical protein